MMRKVVFAAIVVSLAACDNVQQTMAPEAPQMDRHDDGNPGPVIVVGMPGAGGWTVAPASTLNHPATYRVQGTGNTALVFVPGPTGREPSVRYDATQNRTIGVGALTGADSHGRNWTIDLSQGRLNRRGNMLVRSGTLVSACNDESDCRVVLLTW